MIGIFKKIRFGLLSDRRIKKYLVYAAGEITLVVLGILIALQINNWNSKRLSKSDEKKSYANIKYQLLGDLEELNGVISFNNYFAAQYDYANSIILSNDRSQMDTLAIITMYLSQYSDFHREGNIYENLTSSGDIKLLKNMDITNALLKLENIYNHLNKLEEIHWELIMNQLSPALKGVINYATLRIVEPEKLYDVELQNIYIESIYMTRGKDVVYQRASDEIKATVALIDEELGLK
jgi:hypothetical protein